MQKSACSRASSGRKLTWGPPKTTGMPLLLNSSAMAYALVAVAVIVDIPTRSVSMRRPRISLLFMNRDSVWYPLSRMIVARRMLPSRGSSNFEKMCRWSFFGSMSVILLIIETLPSISVRMGLIKRQNIRIRTSCQEGGKTKKGPDRTLPGPSGSGGNALLGLEDDADPLEDLAGFLCRGEQLLGDGLEVLHRDLEALAGTGALSFEITVFCAVKAATAV